MNCLSKNHPNWVALVLVLTSSKRCMHGFCLQACAARLMFSVPTLDTPGRMFLHLSLLLSLLVTLDPTFSHLSRPTLDTLGRMFYTCLPLASLLVSLDVTLASHFSRPTVGTLGRMFLHSMFKYSWLDDLHLSPLSPTCLSLLLAGRLTFVTCLHLSHCLSTCLDTLGRMILHSSPC